MTMAITLVSSNGAPEDPRTWSGTPNNIIKALRAYGCEVTALNVTPSKAERGVLALLGHIIGAGRQYNRSILQPAITWQKMRRIAGSRTFLHVSSATVPRRSWRGDSVHALYLDSTFNTLAKYQPPSLSKGLMRRWDAFEFASLNAVSHVFTTSEFVRENILNHYGVATSKVTVAGTGTGSIVAADGPRAYASHTTLFVAKNRFVEKGGMLLLEGFIKARARDNRLKLVVVGEECYRNRVTAVPGASFYSDLPWETLESLFNCCDLFAMPALYEPYGLVYIEALKCRTPVLGLNRNAVPEFTQNGVTGFLVDEPSADAIASALLDAHSDPARLAEMGCKGMAFVRDRYGWEKVAKRICQVLFPEDTMKMVGARQVA